MDVIHRSKEKQELEARKEAEKRKLFIDDVKSVLGSRAGRNVLWRVIALGGIYRCPFHPSGSVTNLNVGRQQVSREVLDFILEADEEAYFQMRREQKETK